MTHPQKSCRFDSKDSIDWKQGSMMRSLKWWLKCLIFFLVPCFVIQPTVLLAHPAVQDVTFVTQEFRYDSQESGEVYLVWGVDGWQQVPPDTRPPGTVVDSNVMHTLMERDGPSFVAEVQVPVGTKIDYGFQTRKDKNGDVIEWIWDGDYQTTALTDELVTITAIDVIEQSQNEKIAADASLVSQEIYYHMPEAGQVNLVWGINGWELAPDVMRPSGTVIKNSLMSTPMDRGGDDFVVKVQIPAGTKIDYVFQISQSADGQLRNIWDTNGGVGIDYHTVAEQNGIVDIQPSAIIKFQTTAADPDFRVSWSVLLLLVAGCCGILAILFIQNYMTKGHKLGQSLIFVWNLVWQKRLYFIIVFVTILYVIALNPDLYLWGDNARFIIMAKSIALGEGFKEVHYLNNPNATYPIPMFPMMIAPVIYFFGYNLWLMKALVIAVGIGTVCFSYLYFRESLDETFAVLTTLLIAVSPQIVSFSHQVMSELPYLFFLLLSFIFIRKYAFEQHWLTKTGLIAALAIAATCLTRTIGVVILLAAIPYFVLDTPSHWLQSFKKIFLLGVITTVVWLLLNYSLLNNLTYTSDFMEGASNSSASSSLSLDNFKASVLDNYNAYMAIFSETILYLTFSIPSRIITAMCFLTVGYGFLYSSFKKRSILEYYIFLYVAILLLYKPNSMNLGNYQRYLVPLIPFILYYFVQGLQQICIRISDFTNQTLDYSHTNNSQTAIKSAFKVARQVTIGILCAIILLNLASTVQASVLKTQPEMFDYSIYNNGMNPYRYMALWTKENTSSESIIMARNTYLYHFWSTRLMSRYPYVDSQVSQEQLFQAVYEAQADYVVLDTLTDMAPSASDRSFMEFVQQNPDAFELVYQDGDNKIYRILPADEHLSTSQ
ncbi:MAG: glycosyltransferase family 39 protein [Anaerolineae bacterium]|nr:glycosyltransferase family 39 protein [Anaerolineae bacterium]